MLYATPSTSLARPRPQKHRPKQQLRLCAQVLGGNSPILFVDRKSVDMFFFVPGSRFGAGIIPVGFCRSRFVIPVLFLKVAPNFLPGQIQTGIIPVGFWLSRFGIPVGPKRKNYVHTENVTSGRDCYPWLECKRLSFYKIALHSSAYRLKYM